MPYYKFERNDIFHNRIKAHPTVNFNIVTGTFYYNNEVYESGTIPPHSTVDTYRYVKGVPVGNLSLYELNINRSGSDIYPFVTKGGTLTAFKSTTTNSMLTTDFGDQIQGSYPLSASLSSDYYPAVSAVHRRSGSYFGSLGVPLSMSNVLSPHFQFTSDLGDKGTQELRLISIPSIFYGNSIKKGSVSLKFYVTGTLIGELNDHLKRGELRQSGSAPYDGIIAANNLFTHYKFDQTLADSDWNKADGDVLIDSTSNGFNAEPSVGNVIAQVEGKFISGALANSIEEDYFERSSMTMTSSTGASGGFTVTCWLLKSNDPNDGALNTDDYTLIGNKASLVRWRLYGTNWNSAAGKIYWHIRDVDSNQVFVTSSMPNALTDWVHIAATYQAGQTPLLYVNGELQSDQGIHGTIGSFPTGELAAIGDLKIMGDAIGTDYMTGSLDDIRLYNKVLTQREVAAIYNAPSGPGSEVIDGSGSVAGVVLYDQGFVMLTGSWPIAEHMEDYTGAGKAQPRWIDFATTSSALVSSSFQMDFSGTTYVPTVTMMANAPKGQLNQSNNPTFIEYGQSGSILAYTSSNAYIENDKLSIKNVAQSKLTASYASASFEKTTYISKIGLYDKDRNLIGIAKLANPVRKREIDEFTFKLKLDF